MRRPAEMIFARTLEFAYSAPFSGVMPGTAAISASSWSKNACGSVEPLPTIGIPFVPASSTCAPVSRFFSPSNDFVSTVTSPLKKVSWNL
jgi:hypothetical protein